MRGTNWSLRAGGVCRRLASTLVAALLLLTAPAPSSAQDASISGFAFFDYGNDGTRDPDNPTDYGIYNISVYLYTCNDLEIKNLVRTDGLGYYSLQGLPASEYYIDVPTIPTWYVFTEVWNGATDDATGQLLYPDADSAIDPEAGTTGCFELGEGEDKSVSFGMRFAPPPTPPPTTRPTEAGETASPTGGPTNSLSMIFWQIFQGQKKAV